MLCPIHKTKMTQLFTSWVCDDCNPPAGTEHPRQKVGWDLRKVVQNVTVLGPATNYVPGKTPPMPVGITNVNLNPAPKSFNGSHGSVWHLWGHDASELHPPADHDMYYLDRSVRTTIDVHYLATHIYEVLSNDEVYVVKDNYSTRGGSTLPISVNTKAALLLLCRFGAPNKVFFYARKR